MTRERTCFIFAASTFGIGLIVSQVWITPPWRAPAVAQQVAVVAAAPHPAWTPPIQTASVSLPEPVAVREIKPAPKLPAKPKPAQKVKRATPNTQVIYPFGIR